MTLVAWLITRLTANRLPAPSVVWTANVVAALLFGAMHLPQVQALAALAPSLIAFVLAGNGAVGIACGWLYWRRGIVAAMIAHATVDLVLKVAMPLMGFNA
jgi:membrane protease YdiL (CAAX protease family)